MGFLDNLAEIAKDDKKKDEARVKLDFSVLRGMIDSIDDEDKLCDILMSVSNDPTEDEKYVADIAAKKIMNTSREKDVMTNASLYVVYAMKQNGYTPKYPLDMARMAAALHEFGDL